MFSRIENTSIPLNLYLKENEGLKKFDNNDIMMLSIVEETFLQKISENSEAFASEFQENLEEMFLFGYISFL